MSSASVPTAVLIASSFAREGIRSYLDASVFKVLDVYPIIEWRDADEPALIISTPHDVSQSEAIKGYISANPAAKLVLICQPDSLKSLPAHIIRTAGGILDCEIDRQTLINALDLVMGGITVHSSKLMELLLNQRIYSSQPFSLEHGRFASGASLASSSPQDPRTTKPLSPSEIKVLKCLAEGSSNKAIALRFCLAEPTVKIHVKNILRKLNAQNRTQAAIWARENAVHLHGFGEAADRSHVPI